MTAYVDAFGENTIPVGATQYRAYDLTTNATFAWPYNTVGAEYYTADILAITTTNSLSLTLPPGNQASTGVSILLRNLGSNTFTVLDSTGATLGTVAPGAATLVYLTSNLTTAGSWATLLYGTGTSAADAATLQGRGLLAIGATLNENYPVTTTASTTVSQATTDRGGVIVFTGGAATYNLLAAATASNGFSCKLRNAGAGTVTIDPSGVELIDGLSTLDLQPSESLFLMCNGTTWYSVGYGRAVDFNYTKLVKPVTPSVDITLTSAEAANQIITLTGTLSANINLIFPTIVGVYFVNAEWAGAFSVTAKTATGTGAGLGTGATAILICDGVNIFNANSAAAAGISLFGDGTLASPAIAFSAAPSTGFWRSGLDQLSVVCGGLEILRYKKSVGVPRMYNAGSLSLGVDPATGTTGPNNGALVMDGPTGSTTLYYVAGVLQSTLTMNSTNAWKLDNTVDGAGWQVNLLRCGLTLNGTSGVLAHTTLANGAIFSTDTSGNFVFEKSMTFKGVQASVPTAGFSITILPTTSHLLLDPAGVLATGTIVFPAVLDGKRITISSTQTVTALTITSAGTVAGTLTTLAANTPASWLYNATLAKWCRV